MTDNALDDFSSILSSNFDTSFRQIATEHLQNSQTKGNIYLTRTIHNPYIHELIEELTRYRDHLDNHIGSIIAEKTKSMPPLIEPMPVDKQKIVIKSGILDNAIEKLKEEIRDLELENKELEEMVNTFFPQ